MSLALLVGIVGAALTLLPFALGARGARQTRYIYGQLLQGARQRALRRFTVIIPLTRRAETLFPLLDHLYEHGYGKLQIIVVVRQTAGRNAMRDLERYRKKHRRRLLRIVKYQRGMNTAAIASRYATGQYLLNLSQTSRLSPRFFEIVSQVLYATSTDALVVRSLVRPTRTFLRAFWSLLELLRTTKVASLNGSLPRSHVITSRATAMSAAKVEPRMVAVQQFYIDDTELSEVPTPSWRALLSIMCTAFLLVALGAAARFTIEGSSPLIGWLLFVAVELAVFICLLQGKGYRPIDHVNMLLFVPLVPLYAFGVAIVRGASRISAAMRQ